MKQFAHFPDEISMVLESPGSCCEDTIDASESQGKCFETVYIFF